VLHPLERSDSAEEAAVEPANCQTAATYREIKFAGGRYQYVLVDRCGLVHGAFVDLAVLAAKPASDGETLTGSRPMSERSSAFKSSNMHGPCHDPGR
jgi:hypothetical protein